MSAYKHYSFDLWMTLIRSNPSFKQERTKFFYNNFNGTGRSIEEVAAIFRRVDLMCNAINEKTGGNIASEEMYLMVINGINDDNNKFDHINLAVLYNEMEQMLFKYLPEIYCCNTKGVLRRLKEREGITFSLLSNTAFIKGSTLRKALEIIELDSFFDFQIYSDETGISKPDKKLFTLMLNAAAGLRNEPLLNTRDVVHIGDNAIADIYGAKTAGINSILINSNNVSITSLLS